MDAIWGLTTQCILYIYDLKHILEVDGKMNNGTNIYPKISNTVFIEWVSNKEVKKRVKDDSDLSVSWILGCSDAFA